MSHALSPSETTLSRWFRGGPFGALHEEMDRAFADLLATQAFPEPLGGMSPRLDISETDEALEVHTDVPGFQPDEVHIDVVDNQLTISGRHLEQTEDQPEADKGRRYHRIERRSGSFSRTVLLPCSVDADKVDAALKDGVLRIKLPKTAQSRRQRIPIKA